METVDLETVTAHTVRDATTAAGLVSTHGMSVEILRWPEELVRDAALARQGRPRLLLVAPSAAPPSDWDPHTDWIRLPAADEDIWRRVAGLQDRLRQPSPPRLDEFGLVWRDRSWVSLSPVEARIFAVLLEKPGSVRSRTNLARSAWPDEHGNERALNAYIKRIRQRIRSLDLAIHTVRQRGYFLEIDPCAPA
jgi:hypothetical protein